MNSDPLQTRSLPAALWETVPEWIAVEDETLRQKAVQLVNLQKAPWPEISWLTQTSRGTLAGFSALILAWILYRFFQRSFSWRVLRSSLTEILSVAVIMGLGDLTANFIKHQVGRFKPFVNYYNAASPHVPPLSFPSNHAFNAACLLGVMLALGRGSRNAFLWLVVLIASLIGVSRVFLGQHYPSDVVGGWILGLVFGFVTTVFLRAVARRMKVQYANS